MAKPTNGVSADNTYPQSPSETDSYLAELTFQVAINNLDGHRKVDPIMSFPNLLFITIDNRLDRD